MQSARIARRGAIGALTLIAAAAGAGCRKEDAPPPPPRPAYLQGVPALTFARLADTSGTSEADRRTYMTVISIDSARAFYRDTLPKTGWSIMSDRRDSTGLDIYSTKNDLRLWVHAELATVQGFTGTKLMLIGTRDTTVAARDSAP